MCACAGVRVYKEGNWMAILPYISITIVVTVRYIGQLELSLFAY